MGTFLIYSVICVYVLSSTIKADVLAGLFGKMLQSLNTYTVSWITKQFKIWLFLVRSNVFHDYIKAVICFVCLREKFSCFSINLVLSHTLRPHTDLGTHFSQE